jgi:serine phosphatase RsbU (regulator of sigma subunit)
MLFFSALPGANTSGAPISNPRIDSIRGALCQQQSPKERLILIANISLEYMNAGLMDSSRSWLEKGIRLADSIHDEKKMAALQLNMGNSFMMQGIFPKALEHYLKNLEIRERLHDSVNLANSYNSLGIVYFRMNEQDKANDYWNRSLNLCLKFHKDYLAMNTYSNLSMLFMARKDTGKALEFTLKGLSIAEKLNDKTKIYLIASNMGQLSNERKQYQTALIYFKEAIENGGNEANGGRGSPELDGALAYTYFHLNQFEPAFKLIRKAIALGEELKDYFLLEQLYLQLAQMHEARGDFKEAYKAHALYSQYNDSVYNQKNVEKMSDLRAGYEVEKKESQLKQEQHTQELKREVEEHKQKIFNNALLAGSFMLAIFAFFMLRGYQIKKKANDVIMRQSAEIQEKNAALEEVNTEIRDSINYAQRIQEAILPRLDVIQEVFPESFVLFLPKNIVSGDFYFFSRTGKEEVIVAACDCTGHGVPGAFMSMIGTEQLGKIINERGMTAPAQILDELHRGVRRALQQDRNETRDGMDLALCKFNTLTRKLEFAGANRPLWIVKKGDDKVTEIRADKQAIGGLDTEYRSAYAGKEVVLEPGDTVYLSSDGYADQFGGDKGKKFMVRRFQSFLISIAHLPLPEQQVALKNRFFEWKGNAEQVDDILVIGIRV